MSKLYFPNVYRYDVYENLLFISWHNSFECFDFVADKTLFKLNHGFWTFEIINDKIFGQQKNDSDILVYDLKGNLIQTFIGQFYLWCSKLDNQFLFVLCKNEKDESRGFKIDTVTLNIVDKIENYNNPNLLKDNLGFHWLANNIYCYNIHTGNKIWNYDLGTGIKAEHDNCYLNNDNLIITTSDSRLISLNAESGECIWQKKTALHYYTMHPVNKNLYGFGSSLTLEIINSNTGDLIFSKEFPEIKEQFNWGFVSSFSQVREDGLYFIKLFKDKKIGKINIPDHELEFVMDLDIPRGTKLLAPVTPHRNCYFVIDYNENLHVYRPLKK